MWIQGPYSAGQFTNIKIFNKVLWHFLEPGERVKANNGYVGAANKIKSSEVESKTILMGHPILCCHAPVVRLFFFHCKVIISP